MAKFQLDVAERLDYPALGFSVAPGAILDGSLSTPAITTIPDVRWSVYGGGSAETGVTRYAPPATLPTFTEPQDGYVLRYSKTAKAYVPQPVADVTGALLDTPTGDLLATPGTAVRNALEAVAETGDPKRIYVSPGGNDGNHGRTSSKPKLTLNAALAAMGTGVAGQIILGYGDIAVTGTVNWTGYKCGLLGVSALATRLVCTAQTGPVLDLRGVNYDLNGTEFGQFSIIGDGTAGVAKKGLALDPDTSIILANFHDITVRNTGGTPLDLGYTELTVFERLYAYEPVNVVANNVPYFSGTGAFNGNTFRDCQINGISAGANVGASGAVVIKDNGLTAPHSNLLSGFKLNNLHLPQGAAVFALAGNGMSIDNVQIFDTGKVVGVTDTAVARFSAPAVGNFGGNRFTGSIPGRSTSTNDFDWGIDIQQSRNVVDGVKGYRGYNVRLGSGVTDCDVVLRGAVTAADWLAVEDNSGSYTNKVTDTYLRINAGAGPSTRRLKSGGYHGPANHVPGTYNSTAGTMTVIPMWVPHAFTAVTIECEVTTAAASSTVRLGIYAPAANDDPETLVLDAGTVDSTTTGVKSIAISQKLNAGLYWLAAVAQDGAPSLRSVGAGSLAPVIAAGGTAFSAAANCYFRTGVSAALPGAFGGVSPFAGGIKVMVKAA